MQKQLFHCPCWIGKTPEGKANYKKNSRAASKNKTIRKTATTTTKSVGIPQKKQANTKRAKVVPAHAAGTLCGVSQGFSQRPFSCDRKLNAFIFFQDSPTAQMIHLSRTKAASLASSV